MPSTLKEPRITKRKRICGICSKVIGKGAKYHPTSGRKTGAFRDRAICLSCGAETAQLERIRESESQSMKGMVF